MALRNQPYLPLYIQDFLTDEKLIECSAEATGVYIRLLCLMHKSAEYGTILLKQKDKQTESKVKNFAIKIAKQMPYDVDLIERSLNELIEEEVLELNCYKLLQKRMIRDNDISEKRAIAGKKGGGNPNFVSKFVKTKSQTNSEYENENENENENKDKDKKHIIKGCEFVKLTEKEHKKLIEKIGKHNTIDFIDKLDTGIGAKGYKYKSHYHAILNWWRREGKPVNKKDQDERQRKEFDEKYGYLEESKENQDKVKDLILDIIKKD